MPIRPGDWKTFSRLEPARLATLADQGLAQHVREELYPFCTAHRRSLDRSGLGPRGVTGADLLARLPLMDAGLLRAAERNPERRDDYLVRPTDAALRAHWPLVRRAAYALGGPRSARILQHAYRPVLEVPDEPGEPGEPGENRGAGSAGPWWAWSPLDVAVAAESGARALELLGLDRPGEVVQVLAPIGRAALLALHHGALQAGARIVGSDDPVVAAAIAARLRPSALLGPAEAIARFLEEAEQGLGRLWLLVPDAVGLVPDRRAELAARAADRAGRDVGVAAYLALAATRALWVETPAGAPDPAAATGLVTYPDLSICEIVEPEGGALSPTGAGGELVVTGCAGHGTAALRHRTGLIAAGGRTVGSHAGRTLPRLAGPVSVSVPVSERAGA